MDVSGIASAATALHEANVQQAASTAILKKTMDISAENAKALIEAIPNHNATQNLPSHLGQNINTTA